MRLAISQIRALLIISMFLIITSVAYLFPCSAAAGTCEEWVAKIASAQGSVQERRAGETRWVPVALHDTFCPGDMIRVQERSRAAIVLSNESILRLDQNTTITFAGIEKERVFLLKLFSGVAHFFSRMPRTLKVATPFTNGTVEGTEFYVRVEQDRTFMSIFQGRVLAANEAGSLVLESGQSAVALSGRAPVLRIVVRPRDAVKWALYYPPIFDRPGKVPEDTSDPRFLVYRASQLLAVGRVDEADADIKRALRLEPDYSAALALQSIIAVVQNEKDKALDLARKAVEANPQSATARIALSYAQQARFDLRGAREGLKKAVELEPENALAWARLADIWASFGHLGKALGAAKKAAALDPNLSLTQMVLGFAYLTNVKLKESKTAFEKAIELNQAAPLPRLGLGLARIREGNLKEGTREIEIAASLDPNNSLIRSYLGKAYYEEKRTELDGPEYELAKELDPQDPTPWFYNAIRLQTINRPVEALRDMQKAIKLNDNRAVFRSKLLLDSDLAARSASIGRIYNDLGFGQLGLVEGWKSVNTDPSSFSAHRLLADTYAVLPRHQIGRVSELLQSQLLQPINITPIQPLLAENNLFLISGGGPGAVSFREFNPLFNRNRLALQASGIVGESSTYGGEGVVSGIYNRFSFSTGYTHFQTDGFRENADQKDDVVNGFAQVGLTYKTSIQAEYRYRDSARGDVALDFFMDEFSQNLRQEGENNSIRLGFRHAFSPGSDLIGNFQYQTADGSLRDEVDFDFGGNLKTDIETDEDAYGGELSYLFRSERFNFVTGGGYFNIDSDEKDNFEITFPEIVIPPPFPGLPPIVIPSSTIIITERLDLDVNHANLYLYSYISPLRNLTLNVGASGDFLDVDRGRVDPFLVGFLPTEDEDQFNPKFGITWSPFDGTTIRGAVFRTLKRTLIADQTLEPTQVAGFNQFFRDPAGTDAWRYGLAIDQKFTKDIYGGVEFSKRDLEVPFVDFGGVTGELETKEVDWDEYLVRAYLYWTPQEWLSLRAEYLYEEFDRSDPFSSIGFKEVKTHNVPLGINFFHPSGLSAGVTATYYDQKGRFWSSSSQEFFKGEDDFWLIDAAISYRLPKRYGFITVGAKNLFDTSFNYYTTDRDYSATLDLPELLAPIGPTGRLTAIQPARLVFFKVTLAF